MLCGLFPISQISQLAGRETKVRDEDLILRRNRAAKPKGIIEAFVNTCRRWNLEEGQKLTLLGFDSTDPFGKLLLRGIARERSRDRDARVRHVLLISLGLETLFNKDIGAENAWLRYPRKELGESVPLDYMLKGDMVQLMTVAEIVKRERGL